MANKSLGPVMNLDSPDILKMFEPSSVAKRESQLQTELNLRFETNGRVDTLRNSVLSFLATGRYDTAVRELKLYQNMKSAQSAYLKATKSLFTHAIEMIDAMKGLTENKDLPTLPRAKRQDTLTRVRRLFENMKMVLRRLEQIENDLLVQDAKSVVWFLRSTSICVFSIIAIVAFTEAIATLGRPLEVFSIQSADWLFRVVGL